MLINCGACQDIREYLQLSPQARLIVVDSHRPIHARCLQGDRINCRPRDAAQNLTLPFSKPALGICACCTL